MRDVLLSICVPTYNRCIYLKRLLDSIIPQVVKNASLVEICITDNASTDDTFTLCSDYSARYSFIKYIRQNENRGPDVNIHAAYSLASGRYVWIFGDDDYLRVGALGKILDILSNNRNIDMVSMGVLPHGSDKISNDISYPVDVVKFEDDIEFASRIGVMFTFISGLIINKQKVEQYDVIPYIGTYLVQLSWVFRLLRSGNEFVQIKTPLIFAEEYNSGGYRFFEVFSINLSKIVIDVLGCDSSGVKIRISAIKFLLLNLVINESLKNNYEQESYLDVVDKAFSDLTCYRFFYRWFFRYPFILRSARVFKNTLKNSIKAVFL